jgi:spore coat polysaccharide biosynthesis predicted glycosyltransferase SpsG
LAAALATKRVHCEGYVHGLGETLARDGFVWQPADGLTDLRQAARTADVLLLDSYELTTDQLVAEDDRVPTVVFQDDQEEDPHAALSLSIAAVGGTASRNLHGPEYACLRPDFWGLPTRNSRDSVRRVLVAPGSGGGEELGATLATTAAETLPGTEIALLGGAALETPAGVHQLPWQASLLSEFLAADLAITAASQTMLEAMAAGTPCIALATTENQRRQLAALAHRSAVAELRDAGQLVELLTSLAADVTRRRALSQEAQRTVDGYGALRVAYEVMSLVAARA